MACQREQNVISTCFEQSLTMPAITQYACQLVFTNFNTCQLAHKLHLILSWTKTLIASGAKHCTSTCIVQNHQMPGRTKNASQTPHMPTMTQNVFQYMLTIQSHASTDKISMATFVDKTPPIPARTQNVCHLVLTILSHVSRTANALTKPLHYNRAHKMHINVCWSNPTHISEDTKFYQHFRASKQTKLISTCVDQTQPMSVRIQKAYQLVLTKHNT